MNKIIISLLWLLSVSCAQSMEPEAPIIHAYFDHSLPVKSTPTLKELAALKLLAQFDPENATSILLAKRFKKDVISLPAELQEYLSHLIAQEKNQLLEEINDAPAIQLSNKEISGEFQVSPDGHYLAYIAQNRYSNGMFNWPNNTLVVIHISTQKEQAIQHTHLGYGEGGGTTDAAIIFGSDSQSILFASAQAQVNTPIFKYDIKKNSIIPYASIHANESPIKLTKLAENKLWYQFYAYQNYSTGIHDLDYPHKDIILAGFNAQCAADGATIMTQTRDQIYVYDAQGSIKFTLPGNKKCSPVFNNGYNTMILSVLDHNLHFHDINDGHLLKTITFNNNLRRAEFINESFIAVTLGDVPDHNRDIMHVDGNTGGFKIPFQDVWNSYNLSIDNYTLLQKILRLKNPSITSLASQVAFCHDKSLLLFEKYKSKDITNPPAFDARLPYKYYTFYSLIRDTPLSNILDLLLTYKTHKNNQVMDSEILESLSAGANSRILELAQKYFSTRLPDPPGKVSIKDHIIHLPKSLWEKIKNKKKK